MTEAEYDTFKRNFQGKWAWKEDINLKAVYEEVGFAKERIDFELASHPFLTFEVRKPEKDGPNKICAHLLLHIGDKTSTFDEEMSLNEPRVVSDKEQTMCTNFCRTMEGELAKDVIQPVKPPGKEYTMITERVGDEIHMAFKCGDVTGKRVFKMEAA